MKLDSEAGLAVNPAHRKKNGAVWLVIAIEICNGEIFPELQA
jgi:hypothetical protein